jgi:NAD+ diphosphatase
MDHRSQSRLNGLCGYVVDRITHLRSDADWLAARLADPSSRVVPVWRSRNLIRAGDDLSAVMLDREVAAELVAATETLVLLGEDEGIAYFAVGLPGREDDAHARLTALGEFRDLRDTAALLPAREGALLAHARAMVFWHQTHRHCGSCGSPTRSAEAGHSRVCLNEACKRSCYPRTDPAVIVAVSRGERILLGRKPEWPPGRFSTVAGFVEPGETLHQALLREVQEETGLAVVGHPGLFAVYLNEVMARRDHVAVYVVRAFRQTKARAGDLEIVETGFFPVDNLPEGAARGSRERLAEVLAGAPASALW